MFDTRSKLYSIANLPVISIHIYIYREREREGDTERERQTEITPILTCMSKNKNQPHFVSF